MIIKLIIDRFEGKYAILESQDLWYNKKDNRIYWCAYTTVRGVLKILKREDDKLYCKN